MKHVLMAIIAAATLLCACEEEPQSAAVPPGSVPPNTPSTAEGQREALREAAGRAAARQDWARAEAAFEALSRLSPDDIALRRELDGAREHRRVRRVMEETADLLDAGAARSARARLRMIDGATLSADEAEQRAQLEAWLESLEKK